MRPLPPWCRLIRADNPGPMTLEGTNTYVLAAGAGLVVVDPGPLLDQHLSRVAQSGPVVLTLLTHGHPDHAEGAARFHEMTGAPVAAQDPALCLGGAAPLVPGPLPGPGADLEITVLPTPGHTADSVCFLVRSEAVLTGDTVLGRGTAVVAHPDGRLGPYLESLRRLRDLGPLTTLPGHGPPGAVIADTASAYLAHREQRLVEVRAALAAGATSAGEVVDVVYAGIDPALRLAAEQSAAAALEFLRSRVIGDP